MEKISEHQFTMVCAAVLLGTTFIPVGQTSVQVAGRDAYMSVVLVYGLAIPWGLMILAITRNHPGQNLLEVTAALLGKWPGKFLALLYTGAVGYLGILLLARVGDTFRRSILPLVPTTVIIGGMILLVLMLAWSGVENFARFAESVFPLVVFGLLFTMVFSIPRFEPDEYLPILENGVMPVIWGVAKLASYPMEFILFMAGAITFVPREDEGRLKKGLWRASVFVAFIQGALTFTEVMVFGPEEAMRLNYGLLALGKMVEISRTVSGIESLFLLIWMGAEIIKICALFLAAFWGIRHLSGWNKNLWLYLGLALLFMAVAVPRPGGTALALQILRFDEWTVLPLAGCWIPLLFLLNVWKRRRRRT
ncbi:Spore germination GerAB [Acididesulfobacillus acetoxydans]|uniref:Spore germination GerAB n=1 Tax=Acididesulfobacillus acetoxydans TaxID=1561005 RepID=A0A8S0WE50_9FIRM|nr:GerAB/ArcD/ProY family transporter [Acididesulfobacillus acetoxydans]CAA7599862.1 Spore germination GerAB [Acididesulfobacillus acetoxydans]CEJ07428.1 Spore germination protein [Acididesulfobacillus acetoxydans]